MKRNLSIILISILTAMACQKSPSSQTKNYHWIGGEGEEIIMTQRGNVFRGEYVDPGFQERASVPIAGIIDKEGNVSGAGLDIEDGSLYAQFTGKITGNTFEANWSPLPNAVSEHRSWELKQQKLSPEAEREIAKHPDAFYNWLFPELELCTSSSVALNRVTPFLPKETTVAGGRLYGYQIEEWDKRNLRITPSAKAGEVDFHLKIEIDGHFKIEVNMQGTALLSGNTFRYKQKDYEFEVAIYNGFATITTIAGFIDLSAQENVSEDANKVDDWVKFTLDEVYPFLSKGFVDKWFYEINFYCDKDALGSAGGNMEETITKDILSLPEMRFPNAAIMIVDEPTADQPYFNVKAGSNMDDHFATSFWFRVYTKPKYEIKIYDIVSDNEMTLAEWRGSKPTFDEVWKNEEVSDFHENIAFAKSNGKTGVINSVSGEVVVPLIYDELDFYRVHPNRLMAVKEGKYGSIDFAGNTVLSFVYDTLHFRYNDDWAFCMKDKWGLVAPGDKIIIPAEYDDIHEFKNGLAAVKRNGKWGFINKDNKLIVPFKYDSVKQDMFGSAFEGEAAFVQHDGESFWIDKDGKEIHN